MAHGPNTRQFTGFSTAVDDAGGPRDWVLYDIDLIRRDLLNHFNTRKGERVMRPDFGCALWDWLMEPLTPTMHDSIVAEVKRVCQFDSRVNMLSCLVTDLDSGIKVAMELEYVPYAVIQTFTATFEANQANSS